MTVASTLKRLRRPRKLVRTHVPTLTNPVSQACTQAQMAEPAYAYWCARMHELPKHHRKQWEFCFILQALAREGALAPGLRGLGFGVGAEPLPAVFAAQGITVVATDLETAEAHEKGWVETDQHAHSKEMLNDRGICAPDAFDRLVSFRHADMNAIDPDLRDFDFCWSSCALEHLGSIANGLQFIQNSLDCLKPGGIAVHTTEFNCDAGEDTLDNDSTVLFRRSDFLPLGQSLAEAGHELAFNFHLGDQPLDAHIDTPPYSHDNHLKLALAGFVTTSFGIIVRKGGSSR
jgi:SAM-dependent methyltransferase